MTTYHKTGYLHGTAHIAASLSISQVVDIFTSHEKADYLAAKHGVGRSTVYRIKKRSIWSHITKDLVSSTERVNAVSPAATTKKERK